VVRGGFGGDRDGKVLLPEAAPVTRPRRPTREELLAAAGRTVPDVIARGLKVLFCGINPGLYTAAVGHHFARPGNRFWPALHGAGFTDRPLSPFEERELLKAGCGITNLVARATASAAELSDAEYVEGRRRLEAKVRRCRPDRLAVLGVGAYRAGFGAPDAAVGRQAETIGGTRIWVLPNPSGLNANYRMADFIRLFRELREAADG
jgi:double-stranded uracil-DNA glycosylase